MKILVLTNLYPPHHIGGYEIGCKDVVDSLKDRGHNIRVVTSQYGGGQSNPSEGIFREFHHGFSIETLIDKIKAPFNEVVNRKIWKRHLKEFQPAVVYFWNLAQLGTWPLFHTASLGIPSACYVSDQWLENPESIDTWRKRFLGSFSLAKDLYIYWAKWMDAILGLTTTWPPPLLPQLHYTSAFIEEGVKKTLLPPLGSEVIHWGVHSDYTISGMLLRKPPSDSLNILYTGQIVAQKGVKTAILGVIEFIKNNPDVSICFRLAGIGPFEFQEELKSLIVNFDVQKKIVFEGRLQRKKLLGLYTASDIYIFPSEWEEPFAISPLEAMACGCAVIGTTTGGSEELFKDGVNALVFRSGDPTDLSDCLQRLLVDGRLRDTLSINGYNDVIQHYKMSDMVDCIEKKLIKLTNRNDM